MEDTFRKRRGRLCPSLRNLTYLLPISAYVSVPFNYSWRRLCLLTSLYKRLRTHSIILETVVLLNNTRTVFQPSTLLQGHHING